ncbi:MAG: hypothetical protein ACT4P7_15670 [Gemmatimonadaceae bacterium]
MADVMFNFTDEKLRLVQEFVGKKTPLTVISQTPAPGTPLIEGMTVEVRAVSLGDVPLRILDANAHESIRDVPISEFQKLAEGDDLVLEAGRSGGIPDDKRTDFIRKINTGLTGKGLARDATDADAGNIAKSLGMIGFRRG